MNIKHYAVCKFNIQGVSKSSTQFCILVCPDLRILVINVIFIKKKKIIISVNDKSVYDNFTVNTHQS